VSAPGVFFYPAAAAAVISALGMVLNVRNTVAAAMSLVVTMIALAVTYVAFDAHLVAAPRSWLRRRIVVVFLFVVMPLNLRRDEFPRPRAS
jgi:NADH-quinone oxidoreductase subunit J